MSDDRRIRVKEAAELLGLHINDVHRRMNSGDLPYTRYTIRGAKRSSIRLLLSDVIAYRDRCYVPARKAS